MPDVPTDIDELEELTTVSRIRGTTSGRDIFLIGEQHEPPGAEICNQVARNVLEEVEPNAIGVEMPPSSRVPPNSGMGACKSYARENNIMAYRVDKDRREMRESTDSYMRLSIVANEFSHSIEDDGDLNPEAIADARERVRNEFSQDAFRAMYLSRERHMKRKMIELHRRSNGHTVWSGGVFHIDSLSRKLNSVPSAVYESTSPIHRLSETRRI